MTGVVAPAVAPPGGEAPTATAPLHAAAQEFEGLLIGFLLKEARLFPEEGFLGEGGGIDLLSGLAESLLGRHLAHAGGFGIAAALAASLERGARRGD